MKNPAVQRWLLSDQGLATRLRAARVAAGLSGAELARRTGWSKAKISRYESGERMPSHDDIETWAEHTDADAHHLQQLLAEAKRVHTSWAARLTSGQRENQQAYADLTRATTNVWSIEREIIHGELQTPAYARAILRQSLDLHGGVQDVDAAVEARLQRQTMLALPGRKFELVVGEAALRNGVLPPPGMVEQIELIERLAVYPGVRLAIIPHHQPLSLFPHAGFVGYDDQVVLVELPTGEIAFDKPVDVAQFRRVFDLTGADALEGPAALDLLSSIRRAWLDL